MNKKSFREIFGTTQCPTIDFGLEDLPQLAQNTTGKLSISGVQRKLSVKLDKKMNVLIPVASGGEYILKPQIVYPNVPENEQCCMDIADALGLEVPAHCILALKDKSLAYVVKRFDRAKGEKIHQEDFMQILGARDKYAGSVEQIGRKMRDVSFVPGLDVQLFFERVEFNFLIGNGDAHFKNYSMTEWEDGQIRLSPAYDIVCTKLVIPTEDDSALTVNGKKDKLKRKDFDTLAAYLNIPPNVRYERFTGKLGMFDEFIKTSLLDEEKKERFFGIVRERFHRLELEM